MIDTGLFAIKMTGRIAPGFTSEKVTRYQIMVERSECTAEDHPRGGNPHGTLPEPNEDDCEVGGSKSIYR
jgi:hypothetical protein